MTSWVGYRGNRPTQCVCKPHLPMSLFHFWQLVTWPNTDVYKPIKSRSHPAEDTWGMDIWEIFIKPSLVVTLLELMVLVELSGCANKLKLRTEPLEAARVDPEDSSVKCTLWGTSSSPAFSADGDFVIGGVFSFHYKLYTMIYDYTTKPGPPRCTGR